MDRLRQGRLCRCDEFGVEGAGHRQRHGAHAGLAELRHRLFDACLGAGNDALSGGVVVGDAHAVQAVDQCGDVRARRLHGGHAAGLGLQRGLGHRASADRRQTEKILGRDDAGRHQGAVLAVAVSGRRHGGQAEATGEAQIAERQRADRRLRIARVGDRGGLLRLGLGVERRRRPDARAQALGQGVAQGRIGEFDGATQLVHVQRGFAAHVDVLRALAREHEAERRCLRRQLAVQARRRRQRGTVAPQVSEHASKVLFQRVEIGGDERQRNRQAAPGVGMTRQRLRDDARLQRAAVGHGFAEAFELLRQRGVVGRAPQEQLAGPARAARRAAGIVAAIGLEHRVEVGAAEAEGRRRAATRMTGRCQPRACLPQQVDRRLRIGDDVDRPVDAVMARQRAVVQRERDLDQAGGAGRGLGVAEDGLDRADRRGLRRRAAVRQRARDGLRLGAVAHRRAGAVRFDEVQRRRRKARLGIGALQRPDLAFGARRGQSEGTAVARPGGGLDDGIDAVAVALGIGEALERDHGHAFGDGDAVGGLVEGAGLAGRRQRLGLGEGGEREGRLRGVEAAGEHQVAAPGLEFVHRQANGRERRAAGGVDGVVDAAEVEAVGDAPGGDVEQGAGEGLLGPFGQALPDLGRELFDEARQLGAHRVLLAEIAGTAAGAEDHRGVLAIEQGHAGAVVAGVGQRARGGFQRQQLQRVDRLHRLRRNAELERVERHLVEEAAPLRVHLVARLRIGVVEQCRVPALDRGLAQHRSLAQDQLPVVVRRVRAGQGHADADDGDVRGSRLGAARGVRGRVGLQAPAGALADVGMQLGDGLHAVAQGRDLADHVHAVAALAVLGHHDHLAGRIAVEALGGDAQPAEVEILERVADVLDAALLAQQPAALLEEGAGERRVDAARGMPGAGFQVERARAAQRLVLEGLHDRAAGDDLAGEQVGGAHQRADLHAALGQRCGHRRQHRAGRGVVDAAGEQDVDFLLLAGRHFGEQQLDHLFPQREAGDRPDVAAAFSALEHEAARALFQVQAQQGGRRCVDVGRNPPRFERRGLVRTAAGDQRITGPVWRLARPDLGTLLVAQCLRHEAEQADAPGCVADALTRLFEHLAHLRAAHQRKREKRQRARFRDLGGEGRRIRDARHRPLRQRIAGAMRRGQRRAGPQRVQNRRPLDLPACATAQRLDQRSGGAVARAVDRCQADGLAQRQQAFAGPAQARLQALRPRGRVEGAGLGVADVVLALLEQGVAGPGMDAAVAPERFAQGAALGAVEARQLVLQGDRQRRLVKEQQRIVEHDAGGAGRAAGRCRPQADPAAGVQRPCDVSGEFLQQHEAAVGTGPAAGLGAARDQAVEVRLECCRVAGVGDFGEPQMLRARTEAVAQLALCVGAAGKDELQPAVAGQIEQRGGQSGVIGIDAQADVTAGAVQELGEIALRDVGIADRRQIEQTAAAVATDRDRETRVGKVGRAQTQDIESLHVAALQVPRRAPRPGAVAVFTVSSPPGTALRAPCRARSGRDRSTPPRRSTRHDRR